MLSPARATRAQPAAAVAAAAAAAAAVVVAAAVVAVEAGAAAGVGVGAAAVVEAGAAEVVSRRPRDCQESLVFRYCRLFRSVQLCHPSLVPGDPLVRMAIAHARAVAMAAVVMAAAVVADHRSGRFHPFYPFFPQSLSVRSVLGEATMPSSAPRLCFGSPPTKRFPRFPFPRAVAIPSAAIVRSIRSTGTSCSKRPRPRATAPLSHPSCPSTAPQGDRA